MAAAALIGVARGWAAAASRPMRQRPLPRLLLLVTLGAALACGCAGLTKPWQAPEVALRGLQVKELGLSRQSFLATLAVRNPNDRTLPVKAMTYRLELEGRELATGASRLDRQIPAFAEALVDLQVEGSLLGLAAQLPALALKEGPLDWTISGTATLAGGLVTLPYRYSGQVDPGELLARIRPR